jgi:hypothetical protein
MKPGTGSFPGLCPWNSPDGFSPSTEQLFALIAPCPPEAFNFPSPQLLSIFDTQILSESFLKTVFVLKILFPSIGPRHQCPT